MSDRHKFSYKLAQTRKMKMFKMISGLICAGGFLAGTASAQSPVTVVIGSKAPGTAISSNFIGLSFEMRDILPRTNGNCFFNSTNQPLIALFKTLGVKSLRVGGNTADRTNIPVPDPADIDRLFGFAQAADVKVIYTLRLNKGNAENAATTAEYITQHYQPQLAGFAIGNEPDVFSKEYTVYRDEWGKYVAAITNKAPGAKFCGPCSTPTRVAWSSNFVNDFAGSGLIAFIAQHDYPGGDSDRVTNTAAGRDKLLSTNLFAHYEKFYRAFAAIARSNGLPYRFEEANSFYNSGREDVSDTFAAALWGLDYSYWWAAHGANGINFHTGDKVAARDMNKPCRYATFWTSPKGYNVHPIGYGIKAFDLGSHGNLLPLAITNADGVNLTAYAVRDADKNLLVTLINKEHGPGARKLKAAIATDESYVHGQVIFLTAPKGDVSLKTGVTLGGAPIKDDGSWKGKWKQLKPDQAGRFMVKIPAASAAVVKMSPE